MCDHWNPQNQFIRDTREACAVSAPPPGPRRLPSIPPSQFTSKRRPSTAPAWHWRTRRARPCAWRICSKACCAARSKYFVRVDRHRAADISRTERDHGSARWSDPALSRRYRQRARKLHRCRWISMEDLGRSAHPPSHMPAEAGGTSPLRRHSGVPFLPRGLPRNSCAVSLF
jgi:hypothetical protein